MSPKTARRTWLWFLVLVGLVSGCAPSTALLREKNWQRAPGTVRVVVMPPDVQLSELTVGGLLEPKADWTEQGRQHVFAALERHLQTKKATVVPYQQPANGGEDEAAGLVHHRHRHGRAERLRLVLGGAHRALRHRQRHLDHERPLSPTGP